MLALATLVFLAASGAVLAFIGVHRPEVNIASVSITGAGYVREDLLHRMVNDMLNGSYFFLVPRTSIFFYPRTALLKSARELFPAIKDISITRDGFTALAISLTEREIAALWCLPAASGDMAEAGLSAATSTAEVRSSISNTSPCYLMDEDGFVFAKTDDERNVALRVYSGGLSADPLAAVFLGGGYAALEKFVADIARVIGRTPFTISVDGNDDVSVSFSEGGDVRFAREDIDNALLENIASVFSSRRFQEDGEKLKYADFRFGSKIYVKFEGE